MKEYQISLARRHQADAQYKREYENTIKEAIRQEEKLISKSFEDQRMQQKFDLQQFREERKIQQLNDIKAIAERRRFNAFHKNLFECLKFRITFYW